jgi:hypothetical protein
MGDMADFALEEVYIAETDRVDRYYANPVDSKGRFTGEGMDEDGNYPQDEEVRNSPAFYEELNFDKMESVIREASLQLDIKSAPYSNIERIPKPNERLTPFELFGEKEHNHTVVIKGKMPELDSTWFRDRFKTFEMMKGFAKFHKDRGFLSVNQRAIVDTNWIGGSDKFIADLQKFGHDEIISKYQEVSDKLVLTQKKYYSHTVEKIMKPSINLTFPGEQQPVAQWQAQPVAQPYTSAPVVVAQHNLPTVQGIQQTSTQAVLCVKQNKPPMVQQITPLMLKKHSRKLLNASGIEFLRNCAEWYTETGYLSERQLVTVKIILGGEEMANSFYNWLQANG